MALLLPTAGSTTAPSFPSLLPTTKLTVSFRKRRSFTLPTANPRSSLSSSISSPPAVETAPPPPPSLPTPTGWVVVMERPPVAVPSRSETINYYVETLAKVLGSEKAAQSSIYNASWQNQFGFCCDIDEESSKQLSSIPGVLLVRPDKEPESEKKDYTWSDFSVGVRTNADPRSVNSEYWIVRMEKPGVEVVTKAQMVDHYARTLTKVMGNEKDAQVSIYNISWEKDFGFCCQIDVECARELVDVPGVLSVRPDTNFESANKDYKEDRNQRRKGKEKKRKEKRE